MKFRRNEIPVFLPILKLIVISVRLAHTIFIPVLVVKSEPHLDARMIFLIADSNCAKPH